MAAALAVIINKGHPPKLKKFIDKRLSLKLTLTGRHVQEILSGPSRNLVIECVEITTSRQQDNIRMVVIQGDSSIMSDASERV
uniref:small nuclear ribonucleoprotein G-like n=1 Tax=Arvicanthis niloticus TaxID=61156 RepID=UPI001486F434|nr:small nuclear ribonucleoprotein G-like [Arvicanthis niloticus]